MIDNSNSTPRVRDIAAIPLVDKVGLVSGRNFWETEPIDAFGLPSIVLADGTYGLRHQSGQHDHLAMFDSDPATCFPPGVAVGSSWDVDVAARLGAAIATEALAQRVDIVLGPGINIKRSPLCGRNFEYYSEDPHIAGTMGAAFTKALQAEGPGVSVKHFAANNQETNRQTISSDVDARTLREIYLAAFERVVTEAQPATVMSSYNKINGVSASENRWLLHDVLRGEWGFEGVVVSDWNAVHDRVAALHAGLDLEMPGGDAAHDDDLRAAFADGAADERDLDVSVLRLAQLTDAVARRRLPPGNTSVDAEAQHRLAQELAENCAVLLRNENRALPLQRGSTVAVIGAFATEPRYQGGGSAHVNATMVDHPLDALRNLSADQDISITHAPGFVLDGSDSAELTEDAVKVASAADVSVIFAGLSEAAESEGIDRAHIDLPVEQVRLIRAVAAVAPRTVVVLANGGVVSLEGWHDDVDAILEGFLLGQGGGQALARLLLGIANPSGHLAETIPLRLEDHPSSMNFPGEQGHVRYGEGVMVGYRYFATFGAAVRYPFGHGLSYTRFSTGEPVVEIVDDDEVLVTVDVANTGDVTGKHVVQVYVATNAGPVQRPARELRAFEKVELQPGTTATVRLRLPKRAFAYWDVEHDQWLVAPGEYEIQVCADAHTVLHARPVTLRGDVIVTELTMDTPMGVWFDHPLVGNRVMDALGFTSVEVSPEHLAMMSSMTMQQFVNISGVPIADEVFTELIAASRPTD